MPAAKPNPSRLLAAVAIVGAPVAAALLVLAAAGYVAALPAVVAAAAAIAVTSLVVLSHLRRLAAISDYLGRLTRGTEGAVTVPPPGGGAAGATADLHRAAAEAGRHWSARRRELEAVVAANEAVIASLPDPLIMLDRARRIVRANQAAETALGAPLAGRDLHRRAAQPAGDRRRGGGVERRRRAHRRVLAAGAGRAHVPSPASSRCRAPIADGTVALLTLHDLTQAKARRPHARRLRRQRQPRAAHAARARSSASSRPCAGRRASDAEARERFLAIMHEQASAHGAPGRRPAVALAHRAERAHAADRPGRGSARSSAASSTRWSSRPRARR